MAINTNIITIKSDGDGGLILTPGSETSLDVVVDSLMSALYSICLGPDGSDFECAKLMASGYLKFVQNKERESKIIKKGTPNLTLVH